MKVLVIIGELQKVTDKFDSAVACITDNTTCDCLSKNDLCNKLDAVMKHHHCIFCFPEHQ